MDIRHLKTLVAIAESESFMAAADRVALTPAAVSLQMKTLERQLQVTLFDRTTRPPRLNALGAGMIEKARTVLQSYEAFLEEARSSDELAGRLALGCISGITSDLLPRALAALRLRHRHLHVRIDEGRTRDLTQRVLRRELDAAVVTKPPLPEPELEVLPILNEPLVLVTRSSDEPVEDWREALRDRPFLRVNRQSGLGIVIDRAIREAGLTLADEMEFDSTEAILQMAAEGLGAGVVPVNRITPEIEKRITTLPFGDRPVERAVVLIQRRQTPRHHLTRVLYRELRALAKPAKPGDPKS